jgi:dynein heavy chain
MLSSPGCKEPWSESIQQDIMQKMHGFLANMYVTVGATHGKTMLPLPPDEAYQGDPFVNKDRIHLLESAIIRWTKQINSVINTDPDAMHQVGEPEPLIELEFWIQKARNLNAIAEQLESDKMKTLLGFLGATENQYAVAFNKVAASVSAVR